MRYCSSGTPMSHFSWSNYHFSGIFLVGSGPVVFVSCTSFFILLRTAYCPGQSSAWRPSSYYLRCCAPTEVKLSLKRAVAVAIFISILSASSSFVNLKLVATAKIPGFQNPEFQCTKLLVNIAFNGSICRRGEIRSRALSDIFRTFSPYLTEGRSTEEM